MLNMIVVAYVDMILLAAHSSLRLVVPMMVLLSIALVAFIVCSLIHGSLDMVIM